MSARVRIAADVSQRPVRWLWRGYLPLGKIAVLDGDPGLGKSLVTLDIAARVTTGRPMPDGTYPDHDGPAAVIVLAAEDDAADTTVPRLAAAGADLGRIVLWEGVPAEDGSEALPEFPTDAGALLDLIERHGAALVIVDPVMAYLASHVDTRSDQQVRRALLPLKAAAEATGAAVVCIRHLNKAPGANPLYRGGGSIAFIGLARAGLMVGPDPDDETRQVIAPTKTNLGPRPQSLAYRVVAGEDGVPRVAWEGPVSLSARDLLRQEREPSPERQQVIAYVTGAGRPVGAKDVADGLSIKEATARWHLAEAAREGHIERVATGMYAAPTTPTPNNTNKSNGPDTGRVNSVGAVGVVGVGGGSNGANPALPCRACGRAVSGQPDPNRQGWLRFSCGCGLTDFVRANDPDLKWR